VFPVAMKLDKPPAVRPPAPAHDQHLVRSARARGDPGDRFYQAQREGIAGALTGVALIVIVFLMVTKPGL
jgi:hypothetical protein